VIARSPSFLEIRHDLRVALSNAFEIREFELLDSGSWNQCARCSRDGGDLFLKILQARAGHLVRPFEEVEFAYSKLRDFSLDPEVKLILPLAWPNGNLTYQIEGGLAVVFPFIEDLVPFDLENSCLDTVEWIRRAATALAAFHAGVYTPIGRSEFAGASIDIPHVAGIDAWLEGCDAYFLYASERLCRNSPEFDPRKLNFARKFADGLFEGIRQNSRNVALIHGDFRSENVSFVLGLKQLVVFDFDLCRMGSLEEDVVYAALNFAGARWLYCSIDWDRFWIFLDFYYEARGSGIPSDILWWAGWVVAKWITLAFKEEQVIERTKLLREITIATFPGAKLRGVEIPCIDK
jgi:hypothetical protein